MRAVDEKCRSLDDEWFQPLTGKLLGFSMAGLTSAGLTL